MTQPLDQQQRLQALDPLKSICVSAPAGSGKTELLTQRVLTLLARVEQPEHILAITFTRKAAAEMRSRIIETLKLGLGPCPEAAHKKLSWELASKALKNDQESQWQLLANPNRLQIQTIDSFCASLTRMMPVLSQFGSQPAITESPATLYEQACASLFSCLDDEDETSAALSTLLTHLDNDLSKLQRLLISLLAKRDQWLSLIIEAGSSDEIKTIFEQQTQRIVEERLEDIYQQLLVYQADLIPLADYAGCHQNPEKPSIIQTLKGITGLPDPSIKAIKHWQAFSKLLLSDNGQWRKRFDKNVGFPTETIEGDKTLAKQRKAQIAELVASLGEVSNLRQNLELLNVLPETNTYDHYQWNVLNALTKVLPRLVAELLWVFKQEGEVDYSQVTLGALTALGTDLDPTELALRLNHKLQHILIDEFQDTSTSQFSLLSQLIEGWAEYNHSNKENPRTLFLVGDGMQSIYAFRQANVGLFLEAKESGVNNLILEDISLTTNFRSTQKVVNWINDAFQESFPVSIDLSRGAVPYSSSTAYDENSQDSGIYIQGFVDDDGSAEARYIADTVSTIHRNNPDESIAILVRSRNHLQAIVAELSSRKMSWNANEIDPLAIYPAVKDLLTLLTAVTSPHDDIAWAALLRTPWVGLSNQDLYYLASQPQPAFWNKILEADSHEHISKQGKSQLQRLIAVLKPAWAQRQRLAPRLWLHGIWLSLGGAATLCAPEEINYVKAFLELVDKSELAGQIDIVKFTEALDTQFTSLVTPDSNLHLMTIHKSKGLEFDTVILPSLHKQTRSDDKPLFLSREFIHSQGEKSLLMSPIAAKGESDDALYTFLDKESKLASSFEDTRLLYVAATRAIKHLHLLFSVSDKGEGKLSTPGASSLIGKVWDSVEEQVNWRYPEPESNSIDHEQFSIDFTEHGNGQSLSRFTDQWRNPDWQFANPLDVHYLSETEFTSDQESNAFQRIIGTVSHLILEQLVKRGVGHWHNLSTDQRESWLAGLLRHHQLPEELIRDGINDISLVINNTLADDRGRWLLDSHPFSTTEMSLMASRNHHVSERILDRVFLDGNTYWIADYKTSKPRPEESQEAFIERETYHYKNQLHEYSELLRELIPFNEDNVVRKGLYFTYYPLWVEL